MCVSERTRGRMYKYVSCKFVVTQDASKMGDSVVPSPVTYQPLVCGSKRCASDTAVAPISKLHSFHSLSFFTAMLYISVFMKKKHFSSAVCHGNHFKILIDLSFYCCFSNLTLQIAFM